MSSPIQLIHVFNNCDPAVPHSPQHVDLHNNTALEVLTLSRCTILTCWRNTLALLDQVSSSRFRELNISFYTSVYDLKHLLSTYRSQFTALDTHLQKPTFSTLEALTIGLPDDYPDSLITMEAIFPRTAARGLVRVMDTVAMERLVTSGKGAVRVGSTGWASV